MEWQRRLGDWPECSGRGQSCEGIVERRGGRGQVPGRSRQQLDRVWTTQVVQGGNSCRGQRSAAAGLLTTADPQWIWACTKRLAELHPGEPMEITDWENVATELHRNAVPGDLPEKTAEAYTRVRATGQDE